KPGNSRSGDSSSFENSAPIGGEVIGPPCRGAGCIREGPPPWAASLGLLQRVMGLLSAGFGGFGRGSPLLMPRAMVSVFLFRPAVFVTRFEVPQVDGAGAAIHPQQDA